MQYVIDLLPGLGTTFLLWFLILLIGLPGGLILGYMLGNGSKLVHSLAVLVVTVARGFPGLVVLYIAYSGLPELGLLLSNRTAVVVAFAFTTMGYTAEIFRSAVEGVPKAQSEACTALGMSFWKAQRKVILPQAVRNVIPALLGFTVIVLQATSLGYSVGLKELTGLGYNLGSVTFEAMPYMVAAGVIYLVICVAISQLAGRLEQSRPRRHRRRRSTVSVPSASLPA